MWAAVRQLTGHRQVPAAIEGVNAQSLNDHYASISNDPDYTPTYLNGGSSAHLTTSAQQPLAWTNCQRGSLD